MRLDREPGGELNPLCVDNAGSLSKALDLASLPIKSWAPEVIRLRVYSDKPQRRHSADRMVVWDQSNLPHPFQFLDFPRRIVVAPGLRKVSWLFVNQSLIHLRSMVMIAVAKND